MSIYIVYLFLCEFWQFASLKRLIHFLCVIKFMGIELFTVFSYYPFNVHGIYSDVPSYISDINNLCHLSLLAWLEAYQFYWSSFEHYFKANSSWPHNVVRLPLFQFLQNSTSGHQMSGSLHRMTAHNYGQHCVWKLPLIGEKCHMHLQISYHIFNNISVKIISKAKEEELCHFTTLIWLVKSHCLLHTSVQDPRHMTVNIKRTVYFKSHG